MPRTRTPNENILLSAVRAWNDGDVELARSLFAEDIALRSPYVRTPDQTLRGREAALAAARARRDQSPARELVDVLLGVDKLTLLLRDEFGMVAWTLALRSDGKISEIDIAYSVDVSFGVAPLAN